jgi:hypothetical protein
MFINRLTCPNFHESENWPFARISVKCADMKQLKRGRAKDSLKPISAFMSNWS